MLTGHEPRHCEGENWWFAPHAAHQFERAAAMPTHRTVATKQTLHPRSASSDFRFSLVGVKAEALDCFAALAMTVAGRIRSHFRHALNESAPTPTADTFRTPTT
jgi:hypothetical protein